MRLVVRQLLRMQTGAAAQGSGSNGWCRRWRREKGRWCRVAAVMAGAGVAVAQGTGSGAARGKGVRGATWAQWCSGYGSSGLGRSRQWWWLKETGGFEGE